MKAILLPYSALCGACGNLLHVRHRQGDPARVIVHCGMTSCAEYNRRYTLAPDVRELTPLPAEEP